MVLIVVVVVVFVLDVVTVVVVVVGAQRVLLKGLNAWMQNIEKSASRAGRKQAWLSRKFPGVHGIDPHCAHPSSMLRAQKLRGIQEPHVSMHDVPSI